MVRGASRVTREVGRWHASWATTYPSAARGALISRQLMRITRSRPQLPHVQDSSPWGAFLSSLLHDERRGSTAPADHAGPILP